ncbi:MAG: hypothetical protein KJ990_12165 [Proteobacteria bacterium]|nr:hypothetical protein [Pseudomonadota bacterium]MBU1649885.1 hypothetical protein [Pseudomonadota bacterium]
MGYDFWVFAAESVVGGRGLKVVLREQSRVYSVPFRTGWEEEMPVFVGCTFPLESEFLSPVTFRSRDISVSGLLSGKRATLAEGLAGEIEKNYDIITSGIDAARRYGWIFPEEVEGKYKEHEAWYELHFTLSKGSLRPY